MAKRKPRTLVKEIDEAAKLIQRLVRLKASDDNGYCSCVTGISWLIHTDSDALRQWKS